MTTCDWCLQEARVQTIEEKLWRFWILISNEDPNMTSHRNICDKCKSRYEGFSIYIERCKFNTSIVDELLSTAQVKDEPSVYIEYPPLIKKEISNEVDSNSFCPAVSRINEVLPAGNVKKEPLIDIEDDLINAEHVWIKEEASDPDYHTALGGKGNDRLVLRVVLERQVLPGSMVNQKRVNSNRMCTYCGKTFNSPCKLQVHLRSHTGEKPFKCSHCSKSFTQLSHLTIHSRTHTGEKPFKCSHCNKRFGRLSSLNVHLRIHTGVKPFKCSHCSERFAYVHSLNVHLCTHTGEKPFRCSHCNKTFTRLGTLNVHLRIHTGEKPFECSHCHRSFARSSSLKRHTRIHTNIK